MTDRGTRAGWRSAAAVAPTAAAVLAAATGWAVAHPPLQSTGTAEQQSTPASSGPDPALAALRDRADARRAEVARLTATLEQLRSRADRLAAAPARGSVGVSARSGAAVPGPPPAPVPAAPPVTDTSTGAS